MANIQPIENNPWNPYIPTNRDFQRTEELAKKEPFIAGLLTILFPLLGLIYLNRGVNTLKIVGYGFGIIVLLAMGAKTDEDAEAIGSVCGYGIGIAATIEQVRTVVKARERLPKKD